MILPNIVGKVSIVPLPTISRHVRERGFDHTFKIAKSISRLRPFYQVERLLIRAKDTIQVGSSSSVRISQAKKAYQINPKIKINPSTTYILFDDVWTTGASMQSAIKKLQSAGANKILLLILAVS
jgi:predicted amidophosphoribosyltransferase